MNNDYFYEKDKLAKNFSHIYKELFKMSYFYRMSLDFLFLEKFFLSLKNVFKI